MFLAQKESSEDELIFETFSFTLNNIILFLNPGILLNDLGELCFAMVFEIAFIFL